MWQGYFGRQIRRANRNLLMANTLLLFGLLLVTGMSWRYLYNFFSGPFFVDANELVSVPNPNWLRKYFVNVHGERSISTGARQVTRKNGSETVNAYYLALVVKDRLLLVKTPAADRATDFTGGLVDIPGDAQASIVARLEQKYPELKGRFLPMMLDATGFRDSGYWGLAICVPLFLLAIWNLSKGLVRSSNPQAHPIAKALKRYGEPTVVAMRIESELRAEGMSGDPGSAYVTRSWFVYPTTYGVAIAQLGDIAWAYKKITRHSVNFIPTGKTYEVMVWDRSGKSISISGKQDRVELVLLSLAKRAPWVVFGFNKQLEQLWKKSRAEFLAAVDKRKAAPPVAAAAAEKPVLQKV